MMGRMDRVFWRQILAPSAYLLLMGAIAVFANSGLHGEHGLIALRDAHGREAALEAELQTLRDDTARLENLITRLDPEQLDLDLLDERARAVLGLVRPGEIVLP